MKKEFYKEDEIVFQEKSKHGLFKDVEGVRFGRLIVIGYAGKSRCSSEWFCRCNCGNIKVISSQCLFSMKTTSCGCYRKDVSRKFKTTHGRAGSLTHKVWKGIKTRCNNPQNPAYPDYGGRGITICERWIDSFENFLADMGERPGKWASIDRIDNNKGYEPGNCKWATRVEQNNNRRDNHIITMDGISKTLAQWSVDVGINRATINDRIFKLGWSVEAALTTKPRARKANRHGNLQ